MGDKKHYVFSARTTEEGLRLLNKVRAEKNLDWQELLIPAVNARYGIEVPMPEKAPIDEAKLKAKAEKEEAKAAAKAEKTAAKVAKANAAPATSEPIKEQ